MSKTLLQYQEEVNEISRQLRYVEPGFSGLDKIQTMSDRLMAIEKAACAGLDLEHQIEFVVDVIFPVEKALLAARKAGYSHLEKEWSKVKKQIA